MSETTVMFFDTDGAEGSQTFSDNYFMVVDGTARAEVTSVYEKADGTETHVITVKGVRRS